MCPECNHPLIEHIHKSKDGEINVTCEFLPYYQCGCSAPGIDRAQLLKYSIAYDKLNNLKRTNSEPRRVQRLPVLRPWISGNEGGAHSLKRTLDGDPYSLRIAPEDSVEGPRSSEEGRDGSYRGRPEERKIEERPQKETRCEIRYPPSFESRCSNPVKYVIGTAKYHVCADHLQLTIGVASKIDGGILSITETGGIHTPQPGEYEDRIPESEAEFRDVCSFVLQDGKGLAKTISP